MNKEKVTLRQGIERFLENIISTDELYSEPRIIYKIPIQEIAKVVVTLEDGHEIPIYDIEQFVYDHGNDTYYKIDGNYYICYAYPMVFQETYITDQKGNTKSVLNQDKHHIVKVQCFSKSEVSLEDLEQRYLAINRDRQSNVANVFRDTFLFQIKYGLMEMEQPYRPHFIPHENMMKYINHAQEELNEVKQAYEKRDIYECADGLMDLIYVAAGLAGLMQLPTTDLWQDVQNSNMAFKKRVKSLDDSTKRHSTFDVKKTEEWIAPRGKEIINAAIKQGTEDGFTTDEMGIMWNNFAWHEKRMAEFKESEKEL